MLELLWDLITAPVWLFSGCPERDEGRKPISGWQALGGLLIWALTVTLILVGLNLMLDWISD